MVKLAGIAAAGLLLAASATQDPAPRQGDAEPILGLSVASHVAAIAAEQPGKIASIPVSDGERVQAGAILVRLSSRLQELDVARLKSLVDSDVSRSHARAGLAHAQKRAARVKELRAAKISSDSEWQDQSYEVEVARLRVDQTILDHQQLINEYEQAKERLEQRTLRSPIDGIVARTFKYEGESIEKFVPVLEVMRLDPMWIEFECPVAAKGSFRVGAEIEVMPSVRPNDRRTARIVHTSMRADPSSHTFVVRAAVPNSDYSWKMGLKMLIQHGDGLPKATPAPQGK